MSRGPGRLERVIEATLRDTDRSYSIEELALLAYPGINRAEKKHRVAVLRALSHVSKRGDVLVWQWRTDQAGRYFISNGADVRSYAHGWMRQSWWNAERTLEQIDEILIDSEIQAVMEPGGLLWIDVEIAKAEHESWRLLDAAGLREQMRKGRVERDRLPPGYLELIEREEMLRNYRNGLFDDGSHTLSRGGRALIVLLGKFEPPGTRLFEYAMEQRALEQTRTPTVKMTLKMRNCI